MPNALYRRALVPLINLLDRSAKTPHQKPEAYQEGTRYPEYPWDLRTLIIVFPPEAPFLFLNLNILLGMTGISFDQPQRWKGSDPKDAFDLQFCLEGRERHATYKQYHSIERELRYRSNAVHFQLGERLRFEGRWPRYLIQYNQPEENLSLSIQFDSCEGFHWWAYFPRIYCHYTSFGLCQMEWKWRGKAGRMSLLALHDHGWGRNFLPMRMPLRLFRYEVLRLPVKGTSEGFAVSLWTEGAFGTELRQVALLWRDQRRCHPMERYECQVLEWDEFDNYAGKPCRVPRRWIGKQCSKEGKFVYEAIRQTEPRPILGDGFLYGFNYRGEWVGSAKAKVAGEGYVEQMGSLKDVS